MGGRRKFIKQSLYSTFAALPMVSPAISLGQSDTNSRNGQKPLVLSTWNHGMAANDMAMKVLHNGGTIVDAVEQGVMVTESDLSNLSVGLQGLPDREGIVTLDASIMKGDGSCGSVAFVRQVQHPISLARKVMEKTPHVMLVGEGARLFAKAEGMPMKAEILSPKAKEAYEKWKMTAEYKPVINRENHDTIGMVGINAQGEIAGSCTTSGLAYKMHGRVGDSPIIGAGLFADEAVGAATATGMGEEVIRICGAFLIVELMRQGRSPQEACEEAVRRVVGKTKNIKDVQIGFLALNKEGGFGAFAVHPGFNFARHHEQGKTLIDAQSWFKK